MNPQDVAIVVAFILGWHPGYEDVISWGSSGPNGDTKDNAVYQAAARLRAALEATS